MTPRFGLAIIGILFYYPVCGSPFDSLLSRSNQVHRTVFSRPIERSIIKYRPDTLENKWYLAVIIETGQGSMRTLPANMTVGFDYTTSHLSTPTRYDGHVNLPFVTQVRVSALSFEYGHRNGSVFGIGATAYGSTLLSGSLTSSFGVEFRYGYNVPLKKRLWLRPSALLDLMSLQARFDEAIDNHDQDLYIFGHTFPYTSTRGNKQITSAATNVAFVENMTLAKLRLDLIIQLNRFLFLTMGGGYYWTLHHDETIEIYNKSALNTVPFNTPGLDFKSTVPSENVFDANGLSYCIGINFRFGKK